ncbi:MAG TPA: hypothetical protein VFI47_26785 [Acidimicrobiales bacterium]|nr:hypothetical protein [Acidimicrobiales bacterium]
MVSASSAPKTAAGRADNTMSQASRPSLRCGPMIATRASRRMSDQK